MESFRTELSVNPPYLSTLLLPPYQDLRNGRTTSDQFWIPNLITLPIALVIIIITRKQGPK